MLNEEKVKVMTKTAAYENGPEKENIEINNYFRSDYLGLQMIKSALAYTAAFCLLTVLWGMLGTEELMLNLTHIGYLQELIKKLIIFYVAGLVVYEILICIFYSWKYRKMQESIDGYQKYLKNINKFYEVQESSDPEIVEIDLMDEENEL